MMGAPVLPDDQALVVRKLTRASRPKVKSGCGTCKIRHKKCDETRPICNNCNTTGRICDGYIDPKTGSVVGGNRKSRPFQPCSIQELSLLPGPANEHEAQAYLYFENSTAVPLSFALQSRSWTTFILQISHHFTPVKHVVMALGSLSKTFWLKGNPQVREVGIFAREQYRKGITLLRKRLEEDKTSILHEQTLVTCVLFCMCEFMQGNPAGVGIHVRSGIKLFEDYLRKSSELIDPDCLIVRLTRLLYMVDILNILWADSPSTSLSTYNDFTALDTVDAWKGGTPAVLRPVVDELRTMTNLSKSADQRGKDAPIVVPRPAYTKGSKDTFSRLRRQQEGMYWRFEHWRTVVMKETKVDDDDSEKRYYRYHVWRMHYLYATMNLNARLKLDPVDYLENYEDIFIDIINSAEHLVHCPFQNDASQNNEASSTFPFALGFTKPVIWVAANCQSPELRNRAINVLMANPWSNLEWDTLETDDLNMPWSTSEANSCTNDTQSFRGSTTPEFLSSDDISS